MSFNQGVQRLLCEAFLEGDCYPAKEHLFKALKQHGPGGDNEFDQATITTSIIGTGAHSFSEDQKLKKMGFVQNVPQTRKARSNCEHAIAASLSIEAGEIRNPLFQNAFLPC